ncbi:MAG: hypothetical protein V1854_05470, partial [Methanobacteriota archaeon]
MSSKTATLQTINHYIRPEIMQTIQRIAKQDDSAKAGNGDFVVWYYDNKLFNLTKNEDYLYLTNRYRTLYWTLNYFEPIAFERAKINENDIVGTRSETGAYTLGIDIDHAEGCDI